MIDIIIAIVVSCFSGLALGYIIATNKMSKKTIGALRIDGSDPDGPYLFLELETDPRFIENEEYITLKIIAKNYISQK